MLLAGLAVLWGASASAAELAIVIDDIGYNLARGQRAIALPGPLTMAVLPFTPNAARLAERARDAGKDVILHQPMQSRQAGHAARGVLTVDMSPARLDAAFSAALATVPASIGVSNHTGSLLTANRAQMTSLLRLVKDRGLFFIDSRTTATTVAYDVARELGVPALQRDVFLDHDPRPAAIARAFERALAIARTRGHALVIAHPHDTSFTFLEHALPALPPGIELVPVTDLLPRRAPARPATVVLGGDPASPRTTPVL